MTLEDKAVCECHCDCRDALSIKPHENIEDCPDKLVRLSEVLLAVQKLKDTGGCNLCEEKTKPECFINHPNECVILWSDFVSVFGVGKKAYKKLRSLMLTDS